MINENMLMLAGLLVGIAATAYGSLGWRWLVLRLALPVVAWIVLVFCLGKWGQPYAGLLALFVGAAAIAGYLPGTLIVWITRRILLRRRRRG